MGEPSPPRPGPPPGYYYRRRRGSVVWPLILIGAGVIFLLQNFGLLNAHIWGSIGRLWPLLLILVGLEIFLGGAARGMFGILAIGFVALAAVVIVGSGALGSGLGAAAGPVSAHTTTQALQGASSASVNVHFGAGNLDIGQLDGQSGELAQMTYDGPDQFNPSSSYRVRNGQGQLSYSLHGGPPWRMPFFNGGGANGQMNLQLSPEVPLVLNVQEGASESHIDLTQLRVSSLELQTGASHTMLVLPQNAGSTNATIKGGAATIEVDVPQGVAASIQYDGGLSTLNVDQSRFPSTGPRSFRSADYDSAANKVDLTIQAGVATISVR